MSDWQIAFVVIALGALLGALRGYWDGRNRR